MKDFGCTTPFGHKKDSICISEETSKKAFKEFTKSFVTKYHTPGEEIECRNPCTMTTSRIAKVGETTLDDNYALLRCRFSEHVKVINAFFTYSGMSLIAEIGGHVGLFLGISLFNIGLYFERFTNFFQSWKKIDIA